MQTGGCLCGQVRYKITGEPLATILCHCTHCQKASGSAFSVNLMVRPDAFEITGTEGSFTDAADSGSPVYRNFCANCGSSLRSILPSMGGVIAVKAGTLDSPADIKPTGEFYSRSAQSWLQPFEGMERFDSIRSSPSA